MNRYDYKGDIRKGKKSKAAKQAFADMRTDEISICKVAIWPHNEIKIRKILSENILSYEE